MTLCMWCGLSVEGSDRFTETATPHSAVLGVNGAHRSRRERCQWRGIICAHALIDTDGAPTRPRPGKPKAIVTAWVGYP